MFKRNRVINKYRLYCQTEASDQTVWSEAIPSTCPTNASHTIDSGSVTVIDTIYESDTHIRGGMVGSLESPVPVYKNVNTDIDGRLSVAMPTGAFGSVKVVEDTPVIQLDYRYGLNSRLVNTSTSGSASVSAASSLVTLSTGTTSNSVAALSSVRFIKYTPGTGVNMMFTAIFGAGVAGTYQIAGVGSVVSGLFFGYDGASFGIMRRQSSGVDIWTPQSQWNVDTMDGTGAYTQVLDTSKGNVFRISFQWLGFGLITFWIEDSNSGNFLPVHRVQYSNKNLVPHMTNPSFPMLFESGNGGTTSDISLASSSFCAMFEGQPNYSGVSVGFDNSKQIPQDTTVFTSVFTLRNKSTYNGQPNFIPIVLTLISLSTDEDVVVGIFRNANVAGTASWSDIDASTSAMEQDTSLTTVQVNTAPLLTFTLGKDDDKILDIKHMELVINPSDTFTIGVKASRNGTNVTASVSWLEYS